MKVVAQNKKAYHNYSIEDKLECGLVLVGTEIKSIRQSKVSMVDTYVRIKNGEAFVVNLHIARYEEGNRFNHEETRVRKLLMNKREIQKLEQRIKLEGIALIPTKIYILKGFAKLELGIAKGKKKQDKRQDLKEKDAKRRIEKSIKGKY